MQSTTVEENKRVEEIEMKWSKLVAIIKVANIDISDLKAGEIALTIREKLGW